MKNRVNPDFIETIKRYGAFDVNACFSCGNCTAICNLTDRTDVFPRRLIHYGQLGLKDELLSSKELWTCYYCGECSQTCPREAEPGEYMAAVRRYAISKLDFSGLSGLLYRLPIFNVAFTILLGVFLGLFIVVFSGMERKLIMDQQVLRYFDYLSARVLHDLGLTIFAFIGLVAIIGVIRMFIMISKAEKAKGVHFSLIKFVKRAIRAIFIELIYQKRYQKCSDDSDKPWYLRQWFIHGTMLWGFMILWIVTGTHWMMDLARQVEWLPDIFKKATGTHISLLHPLRFFGTIGGILLMYGASLTIWKRLRRSDKYSSHTFVSDWSFLLLLWFSGLTGFFLEIALYMTMPQNWAYYMLLIHVTISMELLLLWPFTKFAHVFYRSIAIFIYALKDES